MSKKSKPGRDSLESARRLERAAGMNPTLGAEYLPPAAAYAEIWKGAMTAVARGILGYEDGRDFAQDLWLAMLAASDRVTPGFLKVPPGYVLAAARNRRIDQLRNPEVPTEPTDDRGDDDNSDGTDTGEPTEPRKRLDEIDESSVGRLEARRPCPPREAARRAKTLAKTLGLRPTVNVVAALTDGLSTARPEATATALGVAVPTWNNRTSLGRAEIGAAGITASQVVAALKSPLTVLVRTAPADNRRVTAVGHSDRAAYLLARPDVPTDDRRPSAARLSYSISRRAMLTDGHGKPVIAPVAARPIPTMAGTAAPAYGHVPYLPFLPSATVGPPPGIWSPGPVEPRPVELSGGHGAPADVLRWIGANLDRPAPDYRPLRPWPYAPAGCGAAPPNGAASKLCRYSRRTVADLATNYRRPERPAPNYPAAPSEDGAAEFLTRRMRRIIWAAPAKRRAAVAFRLSCPVSLDVGRPTEREAAETVWLASDQAGTYDPAR